MLSGDHVGLRAINESDLDQLREWRNQPNLRVYFREYREISIDMHKSWYNKLVLNDPNTRMFAIEELRTGRLLGASGLCYINWVYRSADFSIYLGADNIYIDDKFAPDVANIMIKYAFEELALHRLWAEIYDLDVHKKNFFEKLGFSLDGTFRDTYYTSGKWHNSLFFSLLSTD